MRAVDEVIPLPIDDAPLVTLFAAFFAASACWIAPAVPSTFDGPGAPCLLSKFATAELSDFSSVLWLIPTASVTL